MLMEGILVPGKNKEFPNLPFVKVSAFGHTCLEAGEFLPHDPDGYLAKLTSEVPELDPLVAMYLDEALRTFRTGNYLASAVMVGVASEKTILLLIEKTRDAVSAEEEKHKLERVLVSRRIKVQYDELHKRLDTIMSLLPKGVSESLNVKLEGIYHFIRTYRNDAGHPTGRKIERDEAFAILQLFPSYCRTAYLLIRWLEKNQI